MSTTLDWSPEELPSGWVLLTAKESDARKRELKKEIGKRHPLFGRGLTPIAKCNTCDETLLDIPNEARWAVVLVTWSRVIERAPSPVSTMFGQALPLTELLDHAQGCANGSSV